MQKDIFFDDQMKIIENSWTYKRLTESERANLKSTLTELFRTDNIFNKSINKLGQTSYKRIMSIAYSSYLAALDCKAKANFESLVWRSDFTDKLLADITNKRIYLQNIMNTYSNSDYSLEDVINNKIYELLKEEVELKKGDE